MTSTVPVNNFLLTGTVPVNNFLLTETVLVNNSLLKGTLFLFYRYGIDIMKNSWPEQFQIIRNNCFHYFYIPQDYNQTISAFLCRIYILLLPPRIVRVEETSYFVLKTYCLLNLYFTVQVHLFIVCVYTLWCCGFYSG